jgi:hypothetical protein
MPTLQILWRKCAAWHPWRPGEVLEEESMDYTIEELEFEI